MSASRSVVFAPDSFKGTISAMDAAAALADGWRSVDPGAECMLLPMADGGEGTLAAFEASVPGAQRVPVTVLGPDDRAVGAFWLRLPPSAGLPGGTGVVELGNTSGIERLAELRPLDAHTLGFGQAIVAALDAGVSRLVLGLGSSASSDGGSGVLRALGVEVLDADGTPVPLGARGLAKVVSVVTAGVGAPPPGGVIVLTDVTNPLLGPRGAAAVFGPQKGAGPDDVDVIEAALARFADLVPGVDRATPGAGAAGGTGFGLLAWGATLTSGAPAVAELIGLPAAVAAASIVVTGEGSFDGQSASGKVPAFVAEVAAAAGVATALVAGRIAPDAATDAFAASVSLTDLAGSPAAAMADPARWLRTAGAALAGTFSSV